MQTRKTGTRRAHPKSRNGCAQCRQARIKCNEQAPRCNQCSRRRLHCDFENERTRLRILTPPWARSQYVFCQTKPDPQQQSLPVAEGQCNLPSIVHCGRPHLASYVMLKEPSANFLDSTKSHIFDHFVNETSKTLASNDIPDGFWNVEIPRLALQNDYLLNAVLAVSSLHKSFLEHSNALLPLDVNKSIMWHRKSVESFAQVVPDITPENCVPALAMAAISALYSCGVAQLLSSLQHREHVEQLIAVILAVHKALQVFEPFTVWLNAHGVLLPDQQGAKTTQNNTAALADTAARLSALNSRSRVDSHNNRQVYEETISVWKDSDESNRLKMVPPRFLTLLREKKPMAVLILAAFSFVDQRAESPPWYLHLWHSDFRDYVIEFLGPLWNEYISVDNNAGCLLMS